MRKHRELCLLYKVTSFVVLLEIYIFEKPVPFIIHEINIELIENFLVVTLHALFDISCQSYSITITGTPVALRFARKYHPVCKLNGISDVA